MIELNKTKRYLQDKIRLKKVELKNKNEIKMKNRRR